MSKNRLEFPDLEEHAKALGYILITWGYLQSSIAELLKAMLPIQNNGTKNIISGNTSERDHLKVIRELGWGFFHSFNKTNDRFEEFDKLLKHIDNELRPRRNRYIHDIWVSTGSGEDPLKVDRRTKMGRYEQNGPLVPIQKQDVPVGVEELWEFVREIQKATVCVSNYRVQIPSLDKMINHIALRSEEDTDPLEL